MANMPAASAIRASVESSLANRVPAALTPKIKQAPEVFSTGIADADATLAGGIPRGCITEVSGAASTGRTSFALSVLASVTQLGNACAWVDVHDTLSPESAAAAGVELDRLLWMRMSEGRRHKSKDKPWSRLEQALPATDLLLKAGGFGAVVLDMGEVQPSDALRVPLATWYRFRLAAEHARTALLLVTQAPCAKSSAALTLRCETSSPVPFSEAGEMPLFSGLRYRIQRERNRNETVVPFGRKPMGRVEWDAAVTEARYG